MRSFPSSFAALALAVPTAVQAASGDCPPSITPELESSFGEPVAWLEPGQTVHQPAELTVVGQPVSYVLVIRASGEGGPITELDYRLRGNTKPFGERYSVDLRQAFDKSFSASECGSARNVPCAVVFKSSAADQFNGAELSEGDLSIPKEAHGDGLPLVEADYDLADADPVFLACHYGPAD